MERKLKAKAEDTRTVDIDDAYTLDFWAKEFNVSKEKLVAADFHSGELIVFCDSYLFPLVVHAVRSQKIICKCESHELCAQLIVK